MNSCLPAATETKINQINQQNNNQQFKMKEKIVENSLLA